ncbi:MAG TPA: RNA polymerase sigma-70 factor [Flavisolibacter sp.]|nr:RNA polymerase sigma-70 factor [Flavisolibacter sp.]
MKKEMHQYDDNALFAQIATGDEADYRFLFDKYFSLVYGLALQQTKVPELAKDIAQTVFLKVWEKRQTLETIKGPKAWLLVTTRNEILDFFRKVAVQRSHIQYIKELFQEEDKDTKLLLQQEALLREAIDGLPPKRRQVYLLSREEGKSYEEIASILNISKNTVKEHMGAALKELRAFLEERKGELLALILLAGVI